MQFVIWISFIHSQIYFRFISDLFGPLGDLSWSRVDTNVSRVTSLHYVLTTLEENLYWGLQFTVLEASLDNVIRMFYFPGSLQDSIDENTLFLQKNEI